MDHAHPGRAGRSRPSSARRLGSTPGTRTAAAATARSSSTTAHTSGCPRSPRDGLGRRTLLHGRAGGARARGAPAAGSAAARPRPRRSRRSTSLGGLLAALDRRGRVLAYGAGRGAARGLEVCPGARRLLELRARRVVVRRLPDLLAAPRAARARLLGAAGHVPGPRAARRAGAQLHLRRAHCARAAGADPARRSPRPLPGTPAGLAADRRTAYLTTGAGGRGSVAVDLATGAERPIATVPQIADGLELSPDGARSHCTRTRRTASPRRSSSSSALTRRSKACRTAKARSGRCPGSAATDSCSAARASG